MKYLIYLVAIYFILTAEIANAQSIEWLRGIHSRGSDDGQSIALDSSGNIAVTGWYSDTAIFDPSAYTLISNGGLNGFVTLYDSSGNTQWVQKIGGVTDIAGNGIGFDKLGNCYITGAFFDTITFVGSVPLKKLISAGSADIFIAKYNHAGTLQWAKKAGGSSWDDGVVISVDPVGNFAIVGDFQGKSIFGAAHGDTIISATDTATDLFIADYDVNGNLKWVKEGGGPGNDNGNAVAIDPSGDIYAGGVFTQTASFINGAATLTSAGNSDDVLMKLSPTGSLIWASRAGGSREDFLNGISITNDRCYFIVRNGNGSPIYIDTVTYNSTVISFGFGPYMPLKGGCLISVKKADGGLIRANWLNDTGYCNATALAIIDTMIFIGGEFRQTVSFSYPSDSTTVTSVGEDDLFLSAWDTSGMLKWVRAGGSAGNDFIYSLAANQNRCVGTGTFEDTLLYDSFSLISRGLEDAFIYSMDGIPELRGASQSSVQNAPDALHQFGSEVVGQSLIISSHINQAATVQIFDILGREISGLNPIMIPGESTVPIELTGLAQGVLFCRIQFKNNEIFQKIIR